MSGPNGLAASLVLVTVMAGASHAQAVVPGGWSAQYGYQSLGAVSVMPGSPPGWSPSPGTSSGVYSPYGAYRPMMPGMTAPPGLVAPPRTANSMGMLGDTIRRSTRTRRGR